MLSVGNNAREKGFIDGIFLREMFAIFYWDDERHVIHASSTAIHSHTSCLRVRFDFPDDGVRNDELAFSYVYICVIRIRFVCVYVHFEISFVTCCETRASNESDDLHMDRKCSNIFFRASVSYIIYKKLFYIILLYYWILLRPLNWTHRFESSYIKCVITFQKLPIHFHKSQSISPVTNTMTSRSNVLETKRFVSCL